MILAGIDIGTNAVRMVVAEVGPGSFREQDAARTITRLGEGLERSGALSPASQDRTLEALAGFIDRARRSGAAEVAAVGTSALRKAGNAPDFLERVERELGIAVRVISGEEEARLTLLGVRLSLSAVAGRERFERAAVVDIGGGSTEVIVDKGAAVGTASLHLGAVYLTERYLADDPPTAEGIRLLREAADGELFRSGVLESIVPGAPLIGTAGTVTTLAAMDLALTSYDPERINGHVLTRAALDGMVGVLAGCTLEERRGIPGLERGREDIILAGALVAQAIMGVCAASELMVSDRGLREGVVLDRYRSRSLAGGGAPTS